MAMLFKENPRSKQVDSAEFFRQDGADSRAQWVTWMDLFGLWGCDLAHDGDNIR